MRYFQITKIDSITGKETNYGVNPEIDIALITRGYKQDDELKNMYSRKGSKFFFLVDLVPDF